MADAFYVDPWAGSGDLGLGSDITMNQIVGPQTDGTYSVPQTAQPVNDPSNTAGYSAATPAWVGDVLTKGIGVLGQYLNTSQLIDYRKAEATNGGIYYQGRPALFNTVNGQAQPNMTFWLLVLGGVFVMAHK